MTAMECFEHPFLRKVNEACKMEKAQLRATSNKSTSKCHTEDGIEEDISYESEPACDSDRTLEIYGAKHQRSCKRSHHGNRETRNRASDVSECSEDIQELIEVESPSITRRQLHLEKRGIFTNSTIGLDGYEDDFEDYS